MILDRSIDNEKEQKITILATWQKDSAADKNKSYW